MPEFVAASWNASLPRERARWCRGFAHAVAAHQDELVDLITREVHKPRWQAITGDVLPLLAACRWHEKHASRVLSDVRATGRPWWMLGLRARVRRAPLGTVGIIATWNYPVQLLGIQVVQALMGGNRVIVKPSEHSPRTQARLVELAQDGLPPGTLVALPGTRDAGPALLRDHTLDHVVFTGSTSVGRQIAAWAAERLVPTTLELSGSDSAIVLDDADPDLAARTLWACVVMNAGQTCMAPRRALVTRGVYRRFIGALAPLAAGGALLPLISEGEARRTYECLLAAQQAGGRGASGTIDPPRGHRLRAQAVLDCPRDSALTRGEHFGPALAVIPVADVEDALRVHRGIGQHLSCSIFTSHPRRAAAWAHALGAGLVTINDCVLPLSHPGLALGGRALSGWGESRGVAGLLAMTRPVTITRTSTRLRTPPTEPAPGVLRKIEWLARSIGRVRGKPPAVRPASFPDPVSSDGASGASPTPDIITSSSLATPQPERASS